MSTKASVEQLSHGVVFVAVPLDSHLETMETASESISDYTEWNRQPRGTTSARKTKLEDSVLFWMILVAAATVIVVASMPFIGVSCWMRPMYHHVMRSEEHVSHHPHVLNRPESVHDEARENTNDESELKSMDAAARPHQVTDLTQENFTPFLNDHDMAFVSFYGPDSEWQRFAPIWDAFAQTAWDRHMPIGVGRVNCAEEEELCRDQSLDVFPALLWFQGGVRQYPHYYIGVRSLQHAIDLAELNVKYQDRVTDKKLQQEYLQKLNMIESRHRHENRQGSNHNKDIGDR